ncbi:hypothetical protein H310_12667 [Aphanomyces invadans]|nr:hypothetical protein H310_12667 [Aphanomyces invadans]ETV93422.1 hypothetical protein H310_12667 [Aphanomyces invadans]|eukprot:XP_008878058.1 hypothetical protein H310_12667 [Aphanomyces invadans]
MSTKEYFKTWYVKNKEKVIARVKVYNAMHREAQNARMQQWREKNRAKIAAYREINREQRRQYKRDHYRRTKEKRLREAAAKHASAVDAVGTCPRMQLSFLLHPIPPATSSQPFEIATMLTAPATDYDVYVEV